MVRRKGFSCRSHRGREKDSVLSPRSPKYQSVNLGIWKGVVLSTPLYPPSSKHLPLVLTYTSLPGVLGSDKRTDVPVRGSIGEAYNMA